MEVDAQAEALMIAVEQMVRYVRQSAVMRRPEHGGLVRDRASSSAKAPAD